MRCKIANSKNDPEDFPEVLPNANGIGIQNVKKRLQYLYPEKHELKLSDEGNFFVASLWVELKSHGVQYAAPSLVKLPVAENVSL